MRRNAHVNPVTTSWMALRHKFAARNDVMPVSTLSGLTKPLQRHSASFRRPRAESLGYGK